MLREAFHSKTSPLNENKNVVHVLKHSYDPPVFFQHLSPLENRVSYHKKTLNIKSTWQNTQAFFFLFKPLQDQLNLRSHDFFRMTTSSME